MKKLFRGWLQLILHDLTKRVLDKKHPDIIGITGSVGKSSTKEAIYTVLKGKYKDKLLKSVGNLNNEIGLPLTILGFKKSPKFYEWPLALGIAAIRAYIPQFNPLSKYSVLILEFAADKPGDIYYLTSFLKPRVAVITYIGEAHLEFFDSIDQIAIEKANLARIVPKENGYVILNSDNDYCWKIGLALKDRKKVIYFGSDDKANLVFSNVKYDFNGTEFDLNYKNTKHKIKLNTIGTSQIYSVMAAICVGISYNISLENIIESLKDYHSLSGRDTIVKGINGSQIIDSSYNANPTSMKVALETLKGLKTNGKKIAVLGGMKEIGKISPKAHQEIAEIARNVANKVVLIGDEFKTEKANKWFKTSSEATDFLLDKIEKDDIILVKGSHSIRMDKIVKAFLKG